MIRHALIAVMLLAGSALPAAAQAQKKAGPNGIEEPKNMIQERAASEAYRAALERIPDGGEKYDPWGIVRPAEAQNRHKNGARTTGRR